MSDGQRQAADLDWLLKPDRSWSMAELAARATAPPSERGLYGWYFDRLPARIPVSDCAVVDGRFLAYVGISPSRDASSGTLRKRLRGHRSGNASGSTLRLTLGCLLAEELGIQLGPEGRTARLTFGPGEALLSGWMAEHARVAYRVHPRPWEIEGGIIGRLSLPLNLRDNAHHSFHATLTAVRREAKRTARL